LIPEGKEMGEGLIRAARKHEFRGRLHRVRLTHLLALGRRSVISEKKKKKVGLLPSETTVTWIVADPCNDKAGALIVGHRCAALAGKDERNGCGREAAAPAGHCVDVCQFLCPGETAEHARGRPIFIPAICRSDHDGGDRADKLPVRNQTSAQHGLLQTRGEPAPIRGPAGHSRI